MSDQDVVIRVNDVSKDFVLPHQRKTSIKSVFTGVFEKSSKSSETQHALRNISFDIKKGEFFGIVGRNGSGKSTLLKILAGIYQPTKGDVQVQGKLVPFIELGVGFNPELTGRENVFLNGALLGFDKSQIDDMYEDIVEFAELEKFMDQKLKNYSSGMQVRLAFSMAIRADADILLIDEVLAVGDADFQRKCFEYFKSLKKNKKTVVFVSHDMDAVREYCDRAAFIEKSELVSVDSPLVITPLYTKLFSKSNNTMRPKSKGDDSGRWGDERLRATKVEIDVTQENIKLNIVLKAEADIERVLYGVHVLGGDGREVIATNNRMLKEPDIQKVSAGTCLLIKWNMQNIFSDGKYYVMITLVDSAGGVLDWYPNAASFIVVKEKRSTTSILVPINISVSKIQESSHGKK